MSIQLDDEEIGNLALQLLRDRLKPASADDDDKREARYLAELKARNELWLGLLDKVERVADKILDRLERKGSVEDAARKHLPPKREAKDDDEDEAPDLGPMLAAIAKRPPVDEAARLLLDNGVTGEVIDLLVDKVRGSAPEWAAFFDDDPEWLTGVVEAVKRGGADDAGR